MHQFRWLSAGDPPESCDLRRCGWYLAGGEIDPLAREVPVLADIAAVPAQSWIDLISPNPAIERGSILLLGVVPAGERARLLRLGFGDVMGNELDLAEVEARAEAIADRLASRRRNLPRLRTCGPVQLDLALREGFVGERPLRLNPREFSLMWQLAENPGRSYARSELMKLVWRLTHLPETNSLAVHVHRLRSKLALAGCGGLVQTEPNGGYYLCPETARSPLPGRHMRRLTLVFL